MFQIEWSKNNLFQNRHDYTIENCISNSEELMFIEWEEHCFECAPPICYKTCANYLKRNDLKCQLLKNGILPINEKSSFRPDVYLKFRNWGKLEVIYLSFLFVSPIFERFAFKYNKLISNLIFALYSALPFLDFDNKKRLNGLYTFIKSKFYKILQKANKNKIDTRKYSYSFKFTCYSFSEPFKLIFESGFEKFFFDIKKGSNIHVHNFDIEFAQKIGDYFRIYPENDFNAELIIGNCDITRTLSGKEEKSTNRPKVVVWDLDNTLWNGILVEDGHDKIELRTEIVNSIKKLDSLGIINSIISKNNFDDAINALKAFGIDHYFVFPQINWNAKSENMKALIKKLNVLPDSIIFIDDNNFERDEVKSIFPEIICLDQHAFPDLLNTDTFNFNPTKDAINRRLSYKAEELRTIEESKFGLNYDEFLKSCNIKVLVKFPNEAIEYERINELISRTNQLNLSGTKMSDFELKNLLSKSGVDQVIFSVEDKYGNYGIVGYLNFLKKYDNQSKLVELQILNMFISCRVAQKRIENAVIYCLCDYYNLENNAIITANFIPTSKNKPILDSFIQMGFTLVDNNLKADRKDIIDPRKTIFVSF